MIERAGRLLYGDNFKPQLARALDIDLRTLRRWANESRVPPADVADVLYQLLTQRRAAIALLQRDLMQTLYPD